MAGIPVDTSISGALAGSSVLAFADVLLEWNKLGDNDWYNSLNIFRRLICQV